MNASDAKVIADVTRVGWHVILVPDDTTGPGFAFTIGLYKNYQHPEVIMLGLPHEVMHAVLNLIGKAVKDGHRFAPGHRSRAFFDGHDCAFVGFPARAYEDFLGYARWFYEGDGFPALQCVWPDASGRFPWEPGASVAARAKQPVPSHDSGVPDP